MSAYFNVIVLNVTVIGQIFSIICVFVMLWMYIIHVSMINHLLTYLLTCRRCLLNCVTLPFCLIRGASPMILISSWRLSYYLVYIASRIYFQKHYSNRFSYSTILLWKILIFFLFLDYEECEILVIVCWRQRLLFKSLHLLPVVLDTGVADNWLDKEINGVSSLFIILST